MIDREGYSPTEATDSGQPQPETKTVAGESTIEQRIKAKRAEDERQVQAFIKKLAEIEDSRLPGLHQELESKAKDTQRQAGQLREKLVNRTDDTNYWPTYDEYDKLQRQLTTMRLQISALKTERRNRFYNKKESIKTEARNKPPLVGQEASRYINRYHELVESAGRAARFGDTALYFDKKDEQLANYEFYYRAIKGLESKDLEAYATWLQTKIQEIDTRGQRLRDENFGNRDSVGQLLYKEADYMFNLREELINESIEVNNVLIEKRFSSQ